jgi:hypothetical protein
MFVILFILNIREILFKILGCTGIKRKRKLLKYKDIQSSIKTR